MFLGDVDGCLEHQDAERNARNPGVEAEGREDGENKEDDASRVVAARKHVDGCDEAKNDVEDSRYPDKLLGECACNPHVSKAEDDGRH